MSRMYRGGLTLFWWGYPHCGPFNLVAEKISEGLDEICRQHDMHYALLIELYGKLKTYFYYNEADRCFVENAANITGPASWFTTNVWKVKERFLPKLDESAVQRLTNCEYSKDTNVTKEQQRSTVLYQVKTQREAKVAEAGKMAPETLMTVEQFNRDGDNSGNSENVYDLPKLKEPSIQRLTNCEYSKDTNVTKEQQRSTVLYQVKTQRETKVAEARKMTPETLMTVKQFNRDGDNSGNSENVYDLPKLKEPSIQRLTNCEYSKDTNVTIEQQRSTVLYQVKTQREAKVAEARKMTPETLMTVEQFNRDGDNSGNSENVYDLPKLKEPSVQRLMTYECSKDTNVTIEQQRSTAICQVKTQRETKVAEARKMEPETLMAVEQVNRDGDDSGGSRNLCDYRYINCISALSSWDLDFLTILLYLILIFILMYFGVLVYQIRRVRMQ